MRKIDSMSKKLTNAGFKLYSGEIPTGLQVKAKHFVASSGVATVFLAVMFDGRIDGLSLVEIDKENDYEAFRLDINSDQALAWARLLGVIE